MSDDTQRAGLDVILSDAEAARRMELLVALQAVVTAAGVWCALARRHGLVPADDPPAAAAGILGAHEALVPA